ncbi:hypothetical protein niasHT_038876 [Heterodera trifolii]|uniref:Uncharacterized protein n=1 Tax=Heterodera trifolii TaxID=157864 RepID=A0ABD2IJY8_9BILA
MELLLFRYAEFERLYNCTWLDIDSVPLERRTQFMPESITICVLCAVYYVLYVPCMYSIWKHLHDNSCYKLLFYIGVTDLGILWILGFFSGWLNLRGDVFCSHPILIYVMGIVATSIWMAESTADLILFKPKVLAFNRCLELTSPHFSRVFFEGYRTSLWIVGCSLYALYWAMFIKPVLYSSIYFGWFFYPFVGYSNDDHHQYEHWLHVVHNIAVAFLSPAIYLFFASKLFFNVQSNRRQFGVVASELNSMQKRTFFQVFLVSLINTLTGSLYVYMQSYSVNQWVITLAEFAWLNVHGFPAVIYLALNKTIREDCRMLYMKVFRKDRVSFIGGVTVIRRTTDRKLPTIKSAPL